MTELIPPAPFSFEFAAAARPAAQHNPVMRPDAEQTLGGLERIQRAVEAVGTAAYHWTIDSDAINWSANASEVLGVDVSLISSGKTYAALLDADNFTSRYDTVMRSSLTDQGEGVSFEIEYLFRPLGRSNAASVWLEDHGKWYVGANGHPVEVYGTVRRIDARHQRDQHLSFLGNCDQIGRAHV